MHSTNTPDRSVPEHVRQRYARIAGGVFLIYIAAALSESALFDSAIGSGGANATVANAVANAHMLRAAALLSWVAIVSAFTLAVALFVITRDYDFHLAVAGLVGRVAEGVVGVTYALTTVSMISIGEAMSGTAHDTGAIVMVVRSLREHTALFSASCFAVGSAAFAFLLLRGRAIPAAIAWLGVLASAVLIVALPVQIAGNIRGILAFAVWLPMLAFELVLSVWLLAKGVAPVHRGASPSTTHATAKDPDIR